MKANISFLTIDEELQLRCYEKKIITFDSLPEKLKQKIITAAQKKNKKTKKNS